MQAYRRDIDGLRAVAVLPVVFFHAGAPIFSGGYVGVDIFFVISGFLITGILLHEGERFSVLNFYNRRVRRIFPALFAMLAIVTATAVVMLTPLDLKAYSVSLASTAFFVSNIYFFLGSGYFEASALDKPLLHTWSLAVEEQFYIAWPLALWAMRKLSRRSRLAITLIALVISFAFSVWQTARNADAAFFLPFTRMWELLLGSALAIQPIELNRRAVREAVSALGLGLIGLAVFGFNDSTPFPGAAAAIPCLGAAMLLVANKQGDTAVARLLSSRPAVFVGLISYSLYLWHWPLLSFAHYAPVRGLPWPQTLWPIALAFVLATLSWRYVERPFRGKSRAAKPWKISLPAGAVAMAAALLVAVPVYATHGLPQRTSAAVLRFENNTLDTGTAMTCLPEKGGCPLGAAHGEVTLMLWGDSHAAAIAPGVSDIASAAGISGLRISQLACPPLLDTRRLDSESNRRCGEINKNALKIIAARPELHTVVLAARWALLAETTRVGREGGKRAYLGDDVDSTKSIANSRRALEAGLIRTIDEIRQARPGVRIILIGPAPEPGFNPHKCLARALHLHRPIAPCESISEAEVRARQAWITALLQRAAQAPDVDLFLPADRVCHDGRCPTVADGAVLYRDDDHLNPIGARLMSRGLQLPSAGQ